jgi:hypothetical protein
MLPLPSRTHPKNQTPVVYTEELTHHRRLLNLPRSFNKLLISVHFAKRSFLAALPTAKADV